jgi:hypothetical protein
MENEASMYYAQLCTYLKKQHIMKGYKTCSI